MPRSPATPQPNRRPVARLLLAMAMPLLALHGSPVAAQELEIEATPFSAVIDFARFRNDAAEPLSSLPIWLESVDMLREEPGTAPEQPSLPDSLATETAATAETATPYSVASTRPRPPTHTTYRLRLRTLPGLSDRLLLRLYFDDIPDLAPVVTGWSETGTQYYTSGPLGSGLALPNTATLRIPTSGIDYLDVTVPGDGSTIRQALLSTLQNRTVDAALDFSPAADTDGAAELLDPFDNGASPQEPGEPPPDRLRFGRISAPLDPGEIRITPTGSRAPTCYDVEFHLESAPLLAAITFEILNADPSEPLTAVINNRPLGAINIRFPDLSDPAFSGIARPFESLGFRYASWAPCQKIIPGRLLHPGQNRFTLEVPPGSAPVAIRQLGIQLKHHWNKLDYTLSPD